MSARPGLARWARKTPPDHAVSVNPVLDSALYEGTVWHRRSEPVEHVFQRRLWMAWLDVDQFDEVVRRHPLWGTRSGVVSLRHKDFLDAGADSLRNRLEKKLEEMHLDWPTTRICVLGQPRNFGYLFNPLVLYWFFDTCGERPVGILAEVRNTPWHERHWYALQLRWDGSVGRCEHPKAFHVSPFLPMNMEYAWSVSMEKDRLRVTIENRQGERTPFRAGFTLFRQPMTRTAMSRVMWRYPLQSWWISAGIYIHALMLWWRKVPLYSHPDNDES